MHSNRWTWNSVMTQVLSSVYVSDSDAGQMGFVCTLIGCVTSVTAGFLVDKYRTFKWPLIGLAAFSTLCLGVVQLILYIDSNPSTDELGLDMAPPTVNKSSLIVLYIFVILSGIPQCGITPIAFEFAMELSAGYPCSISGSVLMTIASILSMGQTFGASALLGTASVPSRKNSTDTMWLLIVFVASSGLLMLVPKTSQPQRVDSISSVDAPEDCATDEVNETEKEVQIIGLSATFPCASPPPPVFDDAQKDFDEADKIIHSDNENSAFNIQMMESKETMPVPQDFHPAVPLSPLNSF